jgi:hypothetical protein
MSNSTYIEGDVRDDSVCLPSAPKKEKQRVEDVKPEPQEEKVTPDNFKYNIGDIIKVNNPGTNLLSPCGNKEYHDNLRVIFRFYDGNHVYIVEAEDGICLILPEYQAELVEHSTAPNTPPDNANSRLLDEDTYKALMRLGILDTSVRSYNRGASDYSSHIIQPWTIWQDYNLNPWDADIVKRILRTKQGDSRRLDYEKIIHICEERIRQIDMED